MIPTVPGASGRANRRPRVIRVQRGGPVSGGGVPRSRASRLSAATMAAVAPQVDCTIASIWRPRSRAQRGNCSAVPATTATPESASTPMPSRLLALSVPDSTDDAHTTADDVASASPAKSRGRAAPCSVVRRKRCPSGVGSSIACRLPLDHSRKFPVPPTRPLARKVVRSSPTSVSHSSSDRRRSRTIDRSTPMAATGTSAMTPGGAGRARALRAPRPPATTPLRARWSAARAASGRRRHAAAARSRPAGPRPPHERSPPLPRRNTVARSCSLTKWGSHAACHPRARLTLPPGQCGAPPGRSGS